MRRRLSYLTSRRRGGAHACRHTSSPAVFFLGFSPLCPIVGLGRCRSSAPARLLEVNDDNHSWFPDRV